MVDFINESNPTRINHSGPVPFVSIDHFFSIILPSWSAAHFYDFILKYRKKNEGKIYTVYLVPSQIMNSFGKYICSIIRITTHFKKKKEKRFTIPSRAFAQPHDLFVSNASRILSGKEKKKLRFE